MNNPNPQFSKAHLTASKFNNFKMVETMGLKSYGIEVPLNGITCPKYFMKIYPSVLKLLVGDSLTDRLVIL
jgi:hypothetical protein